MFNNSICRYIGGNVLSRIEARLNSIDSRLNAIQPPDQPPIQDSLASIQELLVSIQQSASSNAEGTNRNFNAFTTAIRSGENLVPRLLNASGDLPPLHLFPPTWSELENLPEEKVTALLAFYGLPVRPGRSHANNLAALRRHFRA
jgi:hypothetical protein